MKRSGCEQIGVVFMYHRVGEVRADPFGLVVSPERFAAQLRELGEKGRLVSLGDLVLALNGAEQGPPLFSVTFDDGYADNLTVAAPILKAYGAPATFFIATGSVASGRRFWWDELASLVLLGEPMSEPVRVRIAGDEWTWNFGASRERTSTWRVSEEPRTPRADAYRRLWRWLQQADGAGRESVFTQLESQLLIEEDEHGRPLTSGELRHLAALDGVDVGAHTVSHPRLASLSTSEQKAEIRESKRWLEACVGRPVEAFSYPYGVRESYTETTAELVRQAGFSSAFVVENAPVATASPPYELPRLHVEDWDGRELRARLVELIGKGDGNRHVPRRAATTARAPVPK
jgi:peptidoglycan/xylan/chitin deacetylase (PgdA/CDA1 family)